MNLSKQHNGFQKHEESLAPYVLSDLILFPIIGFKVGLSPSKINCYLLDWKPFKYDERCFLFRLKSSFCYQEI